MRGVGRAFTSLSKRLDGAFPICFAFANLSAALLVAFPARLPDGAALAATFGLLWAGGIVFVRCTYAPPPSFASVRRHLDGPRPSAYVRAHPVMRALIDAHFLVYFTVLTVGTVIWIHGI